MTINDSIKNEGLRLIDPKKHQVWLTLIDTANYLEVKEFAEFENQLAVIVNMLDMIEKQKPFDEIFEYLASICLEKKSITFAKCVSSKCCLLSNDLKQFFLIYCDQIDKKAENVCPYFPSVIENAHIQIKNFAEKSYIPDFMDESKVFEDFEDFN